MEVIISSNLPDIKGQYRVRCPPDSSIKSLLEQFCRENDISFSKHYALTTSSDLRLNLSQKINHYGIKDGDTLYLDGSDELSPSAYSQWWLLAVVALFIGAVGMIAVTLVKVNGDQQPEKFGVVFDAGSSHTKMFVYKWPGDKENGTGIVDQVTTCQPQGSGISSYSSNPEAAGQSLRSCLDRAKGSIGSSSPMHTPVFLGATAGMRLLNETYPMNSSAVMDSVRGALKASTFMVNDSKAQARILTGAEEGVFGWVTVNYLNNSFHTESSTLLSWVGMSHPHATTGALDLGGASTQFSFIPSNTSAIPPAYHQRTLLYGYEYTVYTHSYLCYGLNEARRRYKANLLKAQKHKAGQTVHDPCLPANAGEVWPSADLYKAPCSQGPHAMRAWGSEVQDVQGENVTFLGLGNSSECSAAVSELFNFTAPCPYDRCSFNGVYQPPLHGRHLAFSGFYYPVQFLNLTTLRSSGYFTLTEFDKARGAYCNLTASEVEHIAGVTMDLKLLYCFQATYVHTLLVQGYGFNADNWNTLQFKQSVRNAELGWTLGFMVNTTNIIPVEGPASPFSITVFVLLILLFCIFLAMSVGFACHARRTHQRLQQEKYQKLGSYGAI